MHKKGVFIPFQKVDRRRKENKHIPKPEYLNVRIIPPAQQKALTHARVHNHEGRCYLCCRLLDCVNVCIDHSINRTVCTRCRGIKGPSHTMDYVLFLLGAPEYHRIINNKLTIVQVNRHFNQSGYRLMWTKTAK